MDVEFVTDHDTEEAFLQWCARRRTDVVVPAAILLAGNVFVLTDLVTLRLGPRMPWPAIVAVSLQTIAFAIAVVARDANRPHDWATPHTELVSLGLLAVSLILLFDARPSVPVFLLFALVVTAIALVLVRGRHAFGFLRAVVPDHGRAEHVHLGAEGIEVTVRPNPRPRVIAWSKVRYLGADARSLFIVAGWVPVVVPRRAFASESDWNTFVDVVARSSEASLMSAARAPMWRHVRSPKARRA